MTPTAAIRIIRPCLASLPSSEFSSPNVRPGAIR
jgi:hypothetical protein